MIKHCIIMGSSYKQGTRIALDITESCLINQKFIEDLIISIKRECEWDAPLSMHFIQTDSNEWSSVEQFDPFFRGVKSYQDISEFAEALKRDGTLFGIDVAKYILSMMHHCTHLKLQKLTYLCYADYLCSHYHKLFEDTIYAFDYGPVVKSVYDSFKGSRYIESQEEIQKKTHELPTRSRILCSDHGLEKLKSIDSTLRRYCLMDASELVELTHQNGTPWEKSYHGGTYEVIQDATIIKYHCNETSCEIL